MRSKSLASIFALSALMIVASSCGKDRQTAMVTLMTGFENQNHILNVMDEVRSQKIFTPVGTSCIQSQILAGFSIKSGSNNGNDPISTFPVNLSTPMYSNGITDVPNAVSWLQSSSLSPISIPAPLGVPLEFGIVGALSISGTQTNGVCDMMATTPADTPNSSISVIGHASTTISGATVVPISLWLQDAQATTLATSPLPPSAASICANLSNSSQNAQACPNLDYSLVGVNCNTATTCISAKYTQFEYFYANNGAQHITQRLPLGLTTGGGVFIPEVNPLTATIFGAGASPLGSVTFNPDHAFSNTSTPTPSPTPTFSTFTGNIPYLTVLRGAGVTPPASFNIYSVRQSLSTISVSWRNPEGAINFNVGTGLTSGGEAYSGSFLTSPSVITVTTPPSTIYVKVRANGGAGATPSTSFTPEVVINTIASITPTNSTGGAGSKQVNVTWAAATNATNYYVSYATVASPVSWTRLLSTPSAGTSTVTLPASATTYYFVIEAENGSGGYSISSTSVAGTSG